MFVIINALKSITRSKGRNVLIGIIVLAIAASSCVALAIRNAANEAEAAGVDLLNITGTITIDRQRLMDSAQSGSGMFGSERDAMRGMMTSYQNLSLEEMLFYSDSDYVKGFYYTSSISLNAVGDLEAYGSDNSSGGTGFQGGMGGQFGGRGGMIAMGDFNVTGYSSEDAMTKFVNGISRITDGEMFNVTSPDMNCLVSYELAMYNGLSVGDTATLVNPNAENETYTFTIAGIYTDSSSGETSGQMMFSTAQDPANLICISYTALQTIFDASSAISVTETNDWGMDVSTALAGQTNGIYMFSSQENYERFGDEIAAKGLSDIYTITSTDVSNYEAGLLPLKNLSDFATTLLFIVLVIGAIILIVINVFNIRERKYEVGVLTAIGIKKGKVAMQFVAELMCVTLMAIIIGAGIGAAISVPVSNNLLSAQVEQTQTQSQNQEQNFGRQGMGGDRMGGQSMMTMFNSYNQAEVSYLDKINATINFSILGQLIAIGILLTLISSLAAVVFVMRYEPLKILAERS